MTIKLHVFPLSPRAFKVMWAANHLGISFEPVLVDFSKNAHRTPEFTGINPNMRMPVLEDGDYVLWESNAILQYLAAQRPESGLLPEETKSRMQIVKWQFWDSAHWDPACAIFAFENHVKKLFGRGEPSERPFYYPPSREYLESLLSRGSPHDFERNLASLAQRAHPIWQLLSSLDRVRPDPVAGIRDMLSVTSAVGARRGDRETGEHDTSRGAGGQLPRKGH